MLFPQVLEPCPTLPFTTSPPVPCQSSGRCCFCQILELQCCSRKGGGCALRCRQEHAWEENQQHTAPARGDLALGVWLCLLLAVLRTRRPITCSPRPRPRPRRRSARDPPRLPRSPRIAGAPTPAAIRAAGLRPSCRESHPCTRRRRRPGRYGPELRCDVLSKPLQPPSPSPGPSAGCVVEWDQPLASAAMGGRPSGLSATGASSLMPLIHRALT